MWHPGRPGSCCVMHLHSVVHQIGCKRRQPCRVGLVFLPRLELHVCHHCRLRVSTSGWPAEAQCELQQDVDWQSWQQQGWAQSEPRVNMLHWVLHCACSPGSVPVLYHAAAGLPLSSACPSARSVHRSIWLQTSPGGNFSS